MKLAVVSVVALALTATAILYFTGPTTKTVAERRWQDDYCVSYHYAARTTGLGIPTGGSRKVCDERADAGYATDRRTVRTSAWDRISGAITGSGDVSSRG
jgi:hypothetical protein